MTITLIDPAALGFGNVIRVNGCPTAVRTVTPSVLTYKGVTFPVVYVRGVAEHGPVVTTLLADRPVMTIKGLR